MEFKLGAVHCRSGFSMSENDYYTMVFRAETGISLGQYLYPPTLQKSFLASEMIVQAIKKSRRKLSRPEYTAKHLKKGILPPGSIFENLKIQKFMLYVT